jgi:putative protease
VVEDEHGGYLLNSKDMCLMPRLNDILRIGMDSLKIEGRNKTEYYAGTVARAYRQAIDDYYKSPESWDYKKYIDELYSLQNRGYCLGFHDGKLTNISQNYEYTRTLGEWLFAGSIVEWQGDEAIFEVRNYINSGEPIDFLIPNGLENERLILNEFEDAETGEITPRVSAGQGKKIRIKSNSWNKPIEQIKKLLPQYVIARKYQGLKGENQEFYEHKRDEFEQLINGCPLEE